VIMYSGVLRKSMGNDWRTNGWFALLSDQRGVWWIYQAVVFCTRFGSGVSKQVYLTELLLGSKMSSSDV
jgi:hypothetical protein